jgi:hypothetical protein
MAVPKEEDMEEADVPFARWRRDEEAAVAVILDGIVTWWSRRRSREAHWMVLPVAAVVEVEGVEAYSDGQPVAVKGVAAVVVAAY